MKEKHAFVGDSTLNSPDSPDDTTIPYLVGEELRRRFAGAAIETADASQIGLYASDALLVVDKLLGSQVDVIVYGLALRALHRDPQSCWVTRIRSQMSPAEIVRLLAVGGAGWLEETISSEQLLAGFAYSACATYAYRVDVRLALWRATHTLWPGLGALTAAPPTIHDVPTAPRPPGYEAGRADYAYPNANWQALELLVKLCRRYAPWRCLLYSGPLNPQGRETAVEPGLYNEYLARVRVDVGRGAMLWRDYTNTMEPDDFAEEAFPGRSRNMIHLNAGGRAKLAHWLAQPLVEITAAKLCSTGKGSCAAARFVPTRAQ